MFNNLKKQQGLVPITVNHYGWFGSDYSFGNKVKDYRDWIEQTHNIKWDEYQSGIICDDQTMLWEFLQYKKIDHKYEFVFDEDSNGFFLIEKQQKEVA